MIVVAAVAGLATVQDQGRPGWMHRGVPPGGALVPSWLARANLAAGNAAAGVADGRGAAAIELVGAITLRNASDRDMSIGVDDGRVVSIRPGDAARIASNGGRPRYLAPRGGIDVPVVWGGRGTLLVARLGGHHGRPLRRDDPLAIGTADPHREARPLDPFAAEGVRVQTSGAEGVRVQTSGAGAEPAAPLRVLAGPDVDRFEDGALATLLGHAFRVSPASDRVGARLEGPPLLAKSAATSRSTPMVRGAIEVPPSGAPIVLGPDHPTTGGYPVIAVVVRADVGGVYAAGLGGTLRFALAESAR